LALTLLVNSIDVAETSSLGKKNYEIGTFRTSAVMMMMMVIESCGTLQFEMLFYPVDISSGGSVPCVSGWRGVSCSIGLASDFFIGLGLHGNLRASPGRIDSALSISGESLAKD